MAWTIYRILREFPNYKLSDILSSEFTTPQFFQLCMLLELEAKEIKIQQKKKKPGHGRNS